MSPDRDLPPREAPSWRDGVDIAVLARADEPALAATLSALDIAASRLTARGHAVSFVVCVNGGDGGLALEDARAFQQQSAAGSVTVLSDARADKARAWNRARDASRAPLIVFSDADVDVPGDSLVRLVEALEARPDAVLASARQVPLLEHAPLVSRAAALPYRFDFGVVGGRLYVMRSRALSRMPERLLLEDGWLSAELGRDRLLTVSSALVRFRPPETLGDYFRERVRTEAGKIQIRSERALAGRTSEAIARYPWRDFVRELRPADWPLAALNLGVRLAARTVAEIAHRFGREVSWRTIASSKPPRPA